MAMDWNCCATVRLTGWPPGLSGVQPQEEVALVKEGSEADADSTSVHVGSAGVDRSVRRNALQTVRW